MLDWQRIPRDKVKIRNTRQRAAIRQAFDSAGRPLSAEEVLGAAGARAAGLGIATVYRSIKSLLAEGWLVAVDLPGEAPRFERAGKEHHHHFRCGQCSRVYEIDGCPGNFTGLMPPGFRITGHDVVLFGVCPGCEPARKDRTGATSPQPIAR